MSRTGCLLLDPIGATIYNYPPAPGQAAASGLLISIQRLGFESATGHWVKFKHQPGDWYLLSWLVRLGRHMQDGEQAEAVHKDASQYDRSPGSIKAHFQEVPAEASASSAGASVDWLDSKDRFVNLANSIMHPGSLLCAFRDNNGFIAVVRLHRLDDCLGWFLLVALPP